MRKQTASVKYVAEHLADALREVVTERMKKRGMTPYALAKVTGLTKTSVLNWVNGRHPIKMNDLAIIATALGTSAVALVGEAEPRAPKPRLRQSE